MQQHRHPSVGEPGRVAPAERLLHLHRQHRRGRVGVVDPDLSTRSAPGSRSGATSSSRAASAHGSSRRSADATSTLARSARRRAWSAPARASRRRRVQQRRVVHVRPRLAQRASGRTPAVPAARSPARVQVSRDRPSRRSPSSRAARSCARSGSAMRRSTSSDRAEPLGPCGRPRRRPPSAISVAVASRVAPASRAAASSSGAAARTRAVRAPAVAVGGRDGQPGGPGQAAAGAPGPRRCRRPSGTPVRPVSRALATRSGYASADHQPGRQVVGQPGIAPVARPEPGRLGPGRRSRRSARGGPRSVDGGGQPAHLGAPGRVVAAAQPAARRPPGRRRGRDRRRRAARRSRRPAGHPPRRRRRAGPGRAAGGCPASARARPRAVTRPSSSTAPRARSVAMAACSAPGGGWSGRLSPVPSGCPHRARSSAKPVRSAAAISGSGWAGSRSCCGGRPAAVDPAGRLAAGPPGPLVWPTPGTPRR